MLVTLAGIRGDRPPLDPDGFGEYSASLPTADIAEMIRVSKPLSAPAQFHCPTYVRHRFERLTRFPAGLLFLGDSICGLNPMFAEGITVAARMVCSTLDIPGPRPAARHLAEIERAAPDDLALAIAYVRVAAQIDPRSALLHAATASGVLPP